MADTTAHADALSSFAGRLREAMARRGVKQVDLVNEASAHGVKLGKSHVSQYVAGKTVPRADTLRFLAGALGVDAAWLRDGTPASAPTPPPDPVPPRPPAATLAVVLAPPATPAPAPKPAPFPHHVQEGTPMRSFKKSSKLDHVLYDVRGPVVDEAKRMEQEGTHVLKLNIGNPAPFGFRTPDEVVQDMSRQLTECEGYSDSKGLFSARKAIMQYAQLKHLPNLDMDTIYTGNGVSELIQLALNALLDDGDEILIPSPDYPLWTASPCTTCATSRPTGTPTWRTWSPRSRTAPRRSSSSTPTTPRAPSTPARCWRKSWRSRGATSS